MNLILSLPHHWLRIQHQNPQPCRGASHLVDSELGAAWLCNSCCTAQLHILLITCPCLCSPHQAVCSCTCLLGYRGTLCACVCVCACGCPDLFKQCPEPMYEALTLHNNIIRRAKYTNCGSTVQQEGDSYTLVRFIIQWDDTECLGRKSCTSTALLQAHRKLQNAEAQHKCYT